MLILDPEQTCESLPWLGLVEALREGFENGCETPLRHAHQFDIPNESSGTLLLMPAWVAGQYLGVKQVLVIPDNGQRNMSAVCASYQLSSAKNGELLAIIDGGVLTNRRTAAASALASTYLSRPDSKHLLMLGTGGLAINLVQAHAAVRPIKNVSIWGRNLEKSQQLANQIAKLGLPAIAVEHLKSAVPEADIISCATLAEKALVKGQWLSQGTHLDLVGAFTANMREADDQAMSRASVFVDTREGSLSEAGEIIQSIAAGAMTVEDIQADLFELANNKHPGRSCSSEITVFKSVGTALEDLTAAVLAYENAVRHCKAQRGPRHSREG